MTPHLELVPQFCPSLADLGISLRSMATDNWPLATRLSVILRAAPSAESNDHLFSFSILPLLATNHYPLATGVPS
jgi:hypothetical protein